MTWTDLVGPLGVVLPTDKLNVIRVFKATYNTLRTIRQRTRNGPILLGTCNRKRSLRICV